MQTIVDVNPLKPGKLEAYKAFAAEITGCDNFKVEHFIATFEENVGMYPQIVHFKK